MKRSKEPTNRIRGSILAEATRQPIPGITVTASQVQGAKRAPLGRAVTAKDGSYELELERLPSLPDNTAATVALSLADGQGRAILAREQMLRVGARQDVRMDFALPCLEHGDDWPDIRYIEGEPVNIRAAASLRRDELIEAYRFLRGRGVKVGVAFAPERIVQGRAVSELAKLPQIVSGVTRAAEDEAAELFGRVAPRIVRLAPREALAFAKLMKGDTAGARGDFLVISSMLDAPEGARARAKAGMDLIDSGSAKGLPAAVKAAAALPRPQAPAGLLPPGLPPGVVAPQQAQPQAPGPQ